MTLKLTRVKGPASIVEIKADKASRNLCLTAGKQGPAGIQGIQGEPGNGGASSPEDLIYVDSPDIGEALADDDEFPVSNTSSGSSAVSALSRVWTYVLSKMPFASQSEMEAGTETSTRSMSPERVKQAIVALGGGGGDLVDDLTPQLGGDLDVNGQKIVSISDGDIVIEPDGAGAIVLGDASGASIRSDVADGATAVAYSLDTENALATSGAKLLNISNGGANIFSLGYDGDMYITSGSLISTSGTQTSYIRLVRGFGRSTGIGFGTYSANQPDVNLYMMSSGQRIFGMGQHVSFGWNNQNTPDNSNPDVVLRRDSAGVLALRNTTAPHSFCIYNTYTNASNYERASLKWDSDTFKIASEAAGTGTQRPIQIGDTDGTALLSGVSDGAGAVAYSLDTENALATSEAKLLSLSNSGVEKLAIAYNGYVGIGKSNPDYLLHLQKADSGIWYTTLSNSNGGGFGAGAGIRFEGSISSLGVKASGRIYSDFKNNSWAGSRIVFQTVTGNDSFVDALTLNGGNVAVGQSSADTRLDVAGSAAAGTVGVSDIIQIVRDTNPGLSFSQVARFGLGRYTTSGAPQPRSRLDLSLTDAATTGLPDNTVMTWQGNGYVGIGNTSPATALDVNGTITTQDGTFSSNVADGATAVAYSLDTANSLATSGARLFTLKNSGVEVFKVHSNGNLELGDDIGVSINPKGIAGGNTSGNWTAYFGQDSSHNAQFGWVYNASVGSAFARFATYGYNNPIRIDASSIELQSISLGNVGVGISAPSTKLDVDGAITQHELSADPSDPAEGTSVTWQSDGTGTGDDGDIMMKITAGGATKTVTIVDFSAA